MCGSLRDEQAVPVALIEEAFAMFADESLDWAESALAAALENWPDPDQQ